MTAEQPVDPQAGQRQVVPAGTAPLVEPAGTTPPVATPTYRAGPNLAVMILGAVCIVAGALAILQVTTGLVVDWPRVAPGLITGLGVLFVLAGVVGIVRRRRRT